MGGAYICPPFESVSSPLACLNAVRMLLLQLEGCFPDTMTRCAELLNQNIDVDFVDINSGCPIDLVYKKVAPPSAPVSGSDCVQCLKLLCVIWTPTGRGVWPDDQNQQVRADRPRNELRKCSAWF